MTMTRHYIIVLSYMTFKKAKPRKVALQANRTDFTNYSLDRTKASSYMRRHSSASWIGHVRPQKPARGSRPGTNHGERADHLSLRLAGANQLGHTPSYSAAGLSSPPRDYVTATEGCGVNTLASSAPDPKPATRKAPSLLASRGTSRAGSFYPGDRRKPSPSIGTTEVPPIHMAPGLLTTEAASSSRPNSFSAQVSVLVAQDWALAMVTTIRAT